MQKCQYINFDIDIRGAAPSYWVSARFDGQTAAGSLELDLDDGNWTGLLARLTDAYAGPGPEVLSEVGRHLFRGVMAGDVHQLWIRAAARDARLRIRLGAYPAEIAALPWELLHDPDRDLPLATGAHLALVRIQTEARFVQRSRTLGTALPLRVLLVVPDDPLGRIDTAAHLGALEELAATVGPDALALRSLTGPVDALTLADAAVAFAPDVLHIVTHGAPDGLMLWQDGAEALVSGQALRIALARAESLRFVMLAACLAGKESAERAFAGVGSQLLQLGIPAVSAMQYEVPDEVAGRFAVALYSELLNGLCPGAVDAAMSYARSTLFVRDPGSLGFATPVLWLNSEDGHIFHLTRGAQTIAPLPSATDADVDRPTEPEPAPLPDMEALTAWLSDLETTVEQTELPPGWLFLASDWQLLAANFRDTLIQLAATSDVAGKRAEMERLRQELSLLTETIRDHGRVKPADS